MRSCLPGGRSRRAPVFVVFVVTCLLAGTVAHAGQRRRSAPAGEIVFVSDRPFANERGEIYALGPGSAPRNLTNSPFGDIAMTVAPSGDNVAFWSDRSGVWRVYVMHGDGSGLQPLIGTPRLASPSSGLAFAPDGRRLLVVTQPPAASTLDLTLFDLTTDTHRTFRSRCTSTVSWSADGQLMACVTSLNSVAVFDTRGKTQFVVGGESNPLWSPGGLLAVTNGRTTRVMNEHGRFIARLQGAAQGWSRDLLALAGPHTIVLERLPAAQLVRAIPASSSPSLLSFTPDGRFIAYSAGADQHWALAQIAGGQPQRLPPGQLFGWSRNERLAFTRPVPGHRLIAIEIGDRFGRHPTEVGRFPYDDHGIEGFAWLPDGSRLLYDWSARPQHDLWAVDASGAGLKRLTSGDNDLEAPAWSADGTHLAYTSASFSGGNCGFCDPQIVIGDPTGRKQALVPLASDNSGDNSVSWSPSGKQIVVSHCCSDEIDLVNLSTGKRTQLANGFAPAWSPDSSTIAYVGNSGVETVDPHGGHLRHLYPDPVGVEITGIAWSHDSRLLAVTTEKALFLVASDGKTPPQTIVGSPATHPSFSADGAWITYAAPARGGEQNDIYIVGLDGSGRHALASNPADDTAPAWRPSP